MSTTHVHSRADRSRASLRQRQGVSRFVTVLVGGLAVATAICLGAIAPVLWDAGHGAISPRPKQSPGQCAAINDDYARLLCYDRRDGRPLGQPAKGANALPPADRYSVSQPE